MLECEPMTPRSGEELTELEARQEPRLVKALEMVAPGTAVREGIDNIVHARTGGLIIIGDPDELAFLFSGGIKLDVDYSPALLYQLAKMDGAIILAAADPELESVEGVGDMRAKDIREGLRRLQEINLVDRYLQT